MPLGDKPLPGIAAADIGKCAYGIFKRSDEYIEKTVGIAGERPAVRSDADAITIELPEITSDDVEVQETESYAVSFAEWPR